jgi:hypothetical protein
MGYAQGGLINFDRYAHHIPFTTFLFTDQLHWKEETFGADHLAQNAV